MHVAPQITSLRLPSGKLVTQEQFQLLAKELIERGAPPGMELEVGGLPVFYNDFDHSRDRGFIRHVPSRRPRML